ncbi:TIGR02328 family protein [Radiobacillus kanasensis]|uniref:TIGR02328 family protein n=1 Tax=Radiobacillus kanasensis TaxID=2844358 RepID=UPI001E30D452|nr:TIGR02328 family protein [Radiobacillus kanasensis]UFT99726.1 TIGR02328 family protein [Radiobacillus kanasensis]
MRLWHESLISQLPRQQLLGQHRECCALRGKGWGKPHSTVNYVFVHSPQKLFHYHELVMEEMERRGYNVNPLWMDPYYRGQVMEPYESVDEIERSIPVYEEHDDVYLQECLGNLEEKGIYLNRRND